MLLSTVIVLVALALLLAAMLFVVSQRFKVYEDPRIGEVESILPGANCGGCGQPGCHSFAEAYVKAGDPDAFFCPVGGADVMTKIAAVIGKEATSRTPPVAVVRCAGSHDVRERTAKYVGSRSCRVSSMLFDGESGCQYGCLGMGDCAEACTFGALTMNAETGLPKVDADKCTACGACVKVCPKRIIELRDRGPKQRRVYVSCVNRDPGGQARKACRAACIGCTKCFKVCPFEAIKIESNLSYIDYSKCKTCGKCVADCPTKAIVAVNMPAPKPPKAEPAPEGEKASVRSNPEKEV